MPKKVVILGAGGHGAVVESALCPCEETVVAGFLDDSLAPGTAVCRAKVLGPLSLLPEMASRGILYFHVAIGNCEARMRLFNEAVEAGLLPLSVVHPKAIIEPFSEIGAGSFVAAGAFVGPRSRIGEGVILNTMCSVDHDCQVGDFAHLCPGTRLAGAVKIGPLATLGTGTSVIPLKEIGAAALVGAGSVIVRDIPKGAKAYGNPCRVKGEAPELKYAGAKLLAGREE